MIRFVTPGRGLAVLILIAVCTACASAKSRLESNACDGLTELPATGTARVCIRENHGPARYTKAMLDGVRIQARTVGSSSSVAARAPGTRYPVGPQQKEELKKLTEEEFESAIDDLQLEKADREGAGVLLVRGQILDVVFEAPTDPQSGASDLFNPVGQATFVVELIDSGSDTLLLRAYDDRATESPGTDAASQPFQLEPIASLWGEMLVESIGYLRGD